jgi:protein SCO1/2
MYWLNRVPAVPPGLSSFSSVKDLANKPLGAIPVVFPVPKFDFVNQHGQRLNNSGLAGHIWIADFVFTRCQGSCPHVTAELVSLQAAITDPNVRFISFSVDPANDDPATLASYAEKYHSQETRWMLLQPPDGQSISQLARKMAAFARSDDVNDPIMHSDFLYLVDASGQVRGLYDTKNHAAMETLKDDVRKLSKPESKDNAVPAGK